MTLTAAIREKEQEWSEDGFHKTGEETVKLYGGRSFRKVTGEKNLTTSNLTTGKAYKSALNWDGSGKTVSKSLNKVKGGSDFEAVVNVGERILRGAVGAGATIATLGVRAFNKKFREEWLEMPLSGKATRTYLVEETEDTPRQTGTDRRGRPIMESQDQIDTRVRNAKAERIRELGFDPKDKKSVAEFMTQKRANDETFTLHGHCYFPYEYNGTTSFLFAPNAAGRSTEIEEAFSVRVFNHATGEGYQNTASFDRKMADYCATYNDKEKEKAKLSEKIAKQLANDRGLGDWDQLKPAVKDGLKKEVADQLRFYRLDSKNKRGYFHTSLDPNHERSDWWSGQQFSFSDQTKKELERIHNPAATDPKLPLRGERVKMKHNNEEDEVPLHNQSRQNDAQQQQRIANRLQQQQVQQQQRNGVGSSSAQSGHAPRYLQGGDAAGIRDMSESD